MKKLTVENGNLHLDGEKISNLKKFNIASSAQDGVAELTICIDVLFETNLNQVETTKSETYVSERIVNIKELEKHIENARFYMLSLTQEMQGRKVLSNLDIEKYLENANTELEEACAFEFCIERRKTIL